MRLHRISPSLKIGFDRAYWDGRKRGFWIGVGVVSIYDLLAAEGWGWLGVVMILGASIVVHWRRPR